VAGLAVVVLVLLGLVLALWRRVSTLQARLDVWPG
jgi:hypothetical protein